MVTENIMHKLLQQKSQDIPEFDEDDEDIDSDVDYEDELSFGQNYNRLSNLDHEEDDEFL